MTVTRSGLVRGGDRATGGFLGVDVRVSVLHSEKSCMEGPAESASFTNDSEGHRSLLAWATGGGEGGVRACLMADVFDVLELAFLLKSAPGVELMVVHPSTVRSFARRELQRVPFDRPDAATILEYARRAPFVPWQPPAPEALKFLAIAWRLLLLKAELARECSRLRWFSQGPDGTGARQEIEASIERISARIDSLQSAARAMVNERSEVKVPDR